MNNTRQLRRDLAVLRDRVPPLLPVVVSRRRLNDCWGYVTLARKEGQPHHFVMVLDNRLQWPALLYILVHEWAHCLAWQEGHEVLCDHGPEFGLAYSRVYQELIEP